MEIRNCRRCGKIFQFTGSYICASCIRQEEEDFKKVKEYLRTHSGSTSLEVSENTEVEIQTIERFIRQGLLDSDEYDLVDGELECEKCGHPIKSGRFCERCLVQLQQDLQGAAQSLAPDRKEVKPEKSSSVYKGTLYTFNAILKKK
jgi:flagellar operon protein (TIGR03826 family)